MAKVMTPPKEPERIIVLRQAPIWLRIWWFICGHKY